MKVTYAIRSVPGLEAPAIVVTRIKPNGIGDDIAWFYLLLDAERYVHWLNLQEDRRVLGGEARAIRDRLTNSPAET